MIIRSDITDWQKKRTQLNHDWLQNQFIMACLKMANILDGEVHDPEYEENFYTNYLAEWPGKSEEIKELFDSFKGAMSPRNLFRQPPLGQLPEAEKELFSDLTETLWLYKNSIDDIISKVKHALDKAWCCYLDLKNDGVKLNRPDFKARLTAFNEAVEDLSENISMFPSKIQS